MQCLQKHFADLKASIEVERALLMTEERKQSSLDGNDALNNIQSILKRKETIKGLDARIIEVQVHFYILSFQG